MVALVQQYETFLINNVGTISTLESSLRSITWFLPGRVADGELASECLSATLNVMSMYHDTLLTKLVMSDPKYKPLIPTTLHTRYTRAWSDKESRYKWAARALETVRFTELVVEMFMKRKLSNVARWRGIIGLEILKALLRLFLLRITRRPLLGPPIPERDLDPGALPSPSTPSALSPLPSGVVSRPGTPEHLKNNREPISPHPLLTSNGSAKPEEYLLSKALTTSAVKPSITLVKSLVTPTEWASEIIYILRPLVYAVMIRSDRHGEKPLLTALCMELLSRYLRRSAPTSAFLERAEYSRRDKAMLWYLLRGSIWSGYTRPKVEALADRISHAPLIGLLGGFVRDWMPLIDEYYYYTSP